MERAALGCGRAACAFQRQAAKLVEAENVRVAHQHVLVVTEKLYLLVHAVSVRFQVGKLVGVFGVPKRDSAFKQFAGRKEVRKWRSIKVVPVSYTHLTLPTNREV